MNTSTAAIQQLQDSLAGAQKAADTIENLIAEHDYQDVAQLVTHAGAALLEAAKYLMEKDDETAFESLEKAEELLDAVYGIIDAETEDDA